MFWDTDNFSRGAVQHAAYKIGATEAAAFRLPDMALLTHLRPDDADATQRAAALAAFEQLIRLAGGKDAAIEICEPVPNPSGILPYAGCRAQYCLIAFPNGRGLLAQIVVAVIAPCTDHAQAEQHLERLRRLL